MPRCCPSYRHVSSAGVPRRERSPLRTRNSAELRLGLEILSAVSSAAAAAAPKRAAAPPDPSERLVDVAPSPRALAKRTAARRAASAAAASSKPSLASSCTAFSLSANGPAPVSPFADAGMQACEGPAPGTRACIVKAETAASPAVPARVVDRVPDCGEPSTGGDGGVVLRTAGGAASEVVGPGADAEGPAAKQGDQAGEMPPGDAAALLARLGVADAQVSYACECNVQARGLLPWVVLSLLQLPGTLGMCTVLPVARNVRFSLPAQLSVPALVSLLVGGGALRWLTS